ncbi:MAG: hypothetical protein ACK4G3_00520 [bacterium]
MSGKVAEINEYLLSEIRPLIKQSPPIADVIVWVKDFNEESGVLHLGLALGNSTGCSPFCGCAARQIAELIGEELQAKFPEIRRTLGIAELPEPEFLRRWVSEE